MNRDVRESLSEVTSEPSPPTIRGRGAEMLGDHQGWAGRARTPAPGSLGHPLQPLAQRHRSDMRGRTSRESGWGRAGPVPGSLRSPLQPRTSWPRPRDPGRPAADRRPSPEEGVGAVVVDLGLGAAAARGRAVRRLLQRRLAYGHRGPRPRSPGAPALAPPHGAWALCRSAPRLDLTHTGSPRTCRARRWERREGVAAIAGGVSGE